MCVWDTKEESVKSKKMWHWALIRGVFMVAYLLHCTKGHKGNQANGENLLIKDSLLKLLCVLIVLAGVRSYWEEGVGSLTRTHRSPHLNRRHGRVRRRGAFTPTLGEQHHGGAPSLATIAALKKNWKQNGGKCVALKWNIEHHLLDQFVDILQ